MKHLLKLGNKKGLSIIIGYVILVSIAIALSVMVYNWLLHYVPQEETIKCPEGITISIRDVYCNATEFNLTFDIKNTGLFSVEGFEIKLNDNEGSNIGLFTIELNNEKFSPGETIHRSYNYFTHVDSGEFSSDLKLLEIQPFVNNTKAETPLYCQSTITDLECNN